MWLSTATVAAIAINSHGAMAAVMTAPRAGLARSYTLTGTVSPNGSTWTPQTVLARGGLANLQVTMSNSGDAVAAFSARNAAGARHVRLASAGLSGVWRGTTPVGRSDVGLTADQTGDALALINASPGTIAESYDTVARARVTAAPQRKIRRRQAPRERRGPASHPSPR